MPNARIGSLQREVKRLHGLSKLHSRNEGGKKHPDVLSGLHKLSLRPMVNA